MRRKVRPALPPPVARPLSPAAAVTCLPTAAAIALALAALGCSAGSQDSIGADPVRTSVLTTTSATPSSTATTAPSIPPAANGPDIEGEMPAVKVVPVPPPPVIGPAPSSKPIKLGGKPMSPHPSI